MLRVGIAQFGNQWVALVTEPHKTQPGRITRVLPPGYATREEAIARARSLAAEHDAPLLIPDH